MLLQKLRCISSLGNFSLNLVSNILSLPGENYQETESSLEYPLLATICYHKRIREASG